MHTINEILKRTVSDWSKILGCSDEKTTAVPMKKEMKKATTKKKASKNE